MNTTMRNFFKYALAGAAMMLLAAPSVAQANETNRRIVVDLKHSTESWFRAETDGVYHRVLDDCATYQAPCRKRVRAEVRIEWAGGGRATLPYGINVQIGAERTGPFFPAYGANCTRRDMWVRIPAGQSSTSWPICLEMDEVAEVAATRDGLGSVVVGLKKVELIGKHRYYSRGPVMSTLKRGFAIVDPLVAGQIPEYRLVPKQTSVFEGEQLTYELRGNKNPNFNMRVRVDYQFTNLDFFDVGSRYTNVLIPANSGEGRAGDYLFDTITINTVNDSVMEPANGAIVARVGKKQSGFNWWAKSWELTSSERALQSSEISRATVTVIDDEGLGNFQVLAFYDALAENEIDFRSTYIFRLYSTTLPKDNLRVRIDFAFSGDFFPVSSGHQYVNVNPDQLTLTDGKYRVAFVPLPSMVIEDETYDTDGSITATIGGKWLGFANDGLAIPLTADEATASSTLTILDDDAGRNIGITVTGPDIVDIGGFATFHLTAPMQIPVNLNVTVSLEYSGQTAIFGSAPSNTLTSAIAANSGRLQDDGSYTFNTVSIPIGSSVTGVATVTAAISSISGSYILSDGRTSTWTRNIAEADQQSATITVADMDAIPAFSIHGQTHVPEGTYINLRFRTPQEQRPGIDLRIRVNYEFIGDFFGDAATSATIDVGPNIGTINTGYYFSPYFELLTVDDDVDEPNGALVVTIASIRLGHSDTATLLPLRESDRTFSWTVFVADNDATPAGRSRSLAADAYRHVVGSHESGVVEQSTSATHAQLTMAFNRRPDVNVQSLVNSIGTAVNSDTDLSELVNLPSFTLPLSAETEVSGPITMWGASNSSDRLAVGQLGMDMAIDDRYAIGMNMTKLESELSETISEDMNMVQSYAAFKLENLDLRLTAIVGLGHGELVMNQFGTFDTARTLAQVGAHSDLLDYQAGPVTGGLSFDVTAGISKHTVAETAEYYGWTTIGRDHALAVTNANTIATAFGEFNPAVWSGFDDNLAFGGGASYDYGGLTASIWLNGKSIAANDNLAVDASYGYAMDGFTITPSVAFTTGGNINRRYGLNIASGGFSLGGAATDSNRLDFNGTIRW